MAPAVRSESRIKIDETMSQIEIRPAEVQDVGVIFELIQALAEYEKLLPQVTATEERLRATLFGERRAAEVLLAYANEECVGFALFFHNYSTFLGRPGLYLEDLFVRESMRGQGVGLALFKRLARLAQERCCGRLEWEVLDWNEPSIRFYKKLGALPLDDWTKYRLSGEALTELAG